MIKIKLAAVLFVVLLLLTGCTHKDDFADYVFSDYPPIENITAETEFSEYDGNTAVINVTVTNDSDNAFRYGDKYYLQKFADDEWKSISTGGFMVQAVLLNKEISEHSVGSIEVKLEDHINFPLLSGKYRVWVGYEEDEEYVSAEFTVK